MIGFFFVAAPDHLSNQIIQGYELVVDLYKYMNRSPDQLGDFSTILLAFTTKLTEQCARPAISRSDFPLDSSDRISLVFGFSRKTFSVSLVCLGLPMTPPFIRQASRPILVLIFRFSSSIWQSELIVAVIIDQISFRYACS